MKVAVTLEFFLPEHELDDISKETLDSIRYEAHQYAERKLAEDKPFFFVTDPERSQYDVTIEPWHQPEPEERVFADGSRRPCPNPDGHPEE